jgi:hypothetical protein
VSSTLEVEVTERRDWTWLTVFRTGLRTLPHVTVVASCVVISAFFLRLNRTPTVPLISLKNTVLRSSVTPHMVGRGPSIVMALDASCQYCRDSLPVIRAISDYCASHATGGLVVVTAGDRRRLEVLLANAHVQISALYTVDPTDALAGYTPRTLVVEANGRVREEWKGRLEAASVGPITDVLRQAAQVP